MFAIKNAGFSNTSLHGMAVVMGTGSGCVASQFDDDIPLYAFKRRLPVFLVVEGTFQGVVKPDLRSSVEHLENVRSVLNPAVSDLAAVFEVSRQAVYKWLSGESQPDDENRSQIVVLSNIADEFAQENVVRAASLLKMKVLDQGRSLLDVVKSKEDWKPVVRLLIEESRAMRQAYDRSGLAQSKAKSTSGWLSSQSIPAMYEEV